MSCFLFFQWLVVWLHVTVKSKMALPGGVNVLALVAVCIIGVGVLLHIIGLATPEWSTDSGVNDLATTLGLWKLCQTNSLFDICADYPFKLLKHTMFHNPDEIESSIKACEAFAILGMLASFLGLAMAALSVAFPMMGKPKNAMFPVLSLAGCVASFLCILIAISVWGVRVHNKSIYPLALDTTFDIGYSFILSIIGGILIQVGGVLAFLGNKGNSQKSDRPPFGNKSLEYKHRKTQRYLVER
ncbi:unnamed protein product [Lymnaea stagnalis]|uniref:Claudin n=1 Tax=Lymnaea stagnalis TaxID=6523 RepID=A0AAV2I3X1_LYMST